jgi:hypothetical protein
LATNEWKAVKICIDGGRSRQHLGFGSLKENDVRTTIARHTKPLDQLRVPLRVFKRSIIEPLN